MSRETHLIDFHKRHGGRLVEFAGWILPVLYSGIIEEHMAVRERVGMFDVSHMGQCRVKGKDALNFLNYGLTNDFSSLEDGRAKYSIMCYSDGNCVDDVIVYREGKDNYFIVLNASNIEKDIENLRRIKDEKGFSVEIEDESDRYSMLAIQGRDSDNAMGKVFGEEFCDLKKFGFRKVGEKLVSRTGYTGSEGYEIICPNDGVVGLAEKFVSEGVKLCGLGSRDSLRLEAQYPLYGHEISDKINPIEANLGWAVKMEKEFVGRDALRDWDRGNRVVYFEVEDKRMVREGSEIYFGEEVVGKILSGAWSAVLNKPICSSLVKKEYIEKELFAKIRNNLISLRKKNRFL